MHNHPTDPAFKPTICTPIGYSVTLTGIRILGSFTMRYIFPFLKHRDLCPSNGGSGLDHPCSWVTSSGPETLRLVYLGHLYSWRFTNLVGNTVIQFGGLCGWAIHKVPGTSGRSFGGHISCWIGALVHQNSTSIPNLGYVHGVLVRWAQHPCCSRIPKDRYFCRTGQHLGPNPAVSQ